MRSMRWRVLGLGIVVALAVSVAVVPSASASFPEFGICVKVLKTENGEGKLVYQGHWADAKCTRPSVRTNGVYKGRFEFEAPRNGKCVLQPKPVAPAKYTGKWLDSLCTKPSAKAPTSGKYELVAAAKPGFTTVTGKATLSTPKMTMNCVSGGGEGTYVGKTAVEAIATFHECSYKLGALEIPYCETGTPAVNGKGEHIIIPNDGAGNIMTNPLTGHLGYVNHVSKSKPAIGVELAPKAGDPEGTDSKGVKHVLFVKFYCGPIEGLGWTAMEWWGHQALGGFIGAIHEQRIVSGKAVAVPVNKPATEAVLEFAQKGEETAIQGITQFEESLGVFGPEEYLESQTLGIERFAQISNSVTTGEEALEIKA